MLPAGQQQEQPDFMQPPATPPHPGGRIRAAALLKSLASGAGWIFLAVAAAEMVLPDSVKPSIILGSFHGNTEKAEITAAGPSKVELERRMAESRAAPP